MVALSLQQSGVEFWQRALPSAERGLSRWMCQDSNRHLGVRVRIYNPDLGQIHLVARCEHMFSDGRGQHIPLPQCSTMLTNCHRLHFMDYLTIIIILLIINAWHCILLFILLCFPAHASPLPHMTCHHQILSSTLYLYSSACVCVNHH